MVYTTKPPFGTQLDLTHPLNSGLAALWIFNEGTGNIVYDISNNNNTGILTNMSFPSTPISGWNPGLNEQPAIAFDAIDDNISCRNSTSLNITDPLTISATFKVTNIGPNIYSTIIEKAGFGTAGNRRQYGLLIGDEKNSKWNELVFTYNDGAWRSFRTTNAGITKNIWYKVVVIIHKTTPLTADFYLDGRLLSNIGYTPSNSLPLTNWDVKIGSAWFDDRPGFVFNGLIDEVRIWNRELYLSETLTLNTNPYEMFIDARPPPCETPICDIMIIEG